MEKKNCSVVTEFILLGIPHTEGPETILFVLFLPFYAFTLLGNLSILVAVLSSTCLHTPMYFFLGNLLSVFDMSFSSVTCPKMLLYLIGLSPIISYKDCVSQLFFFHFLGSVECFLYTVMAYDCFTAICYPLQYTVIMNPRICVALAVGTWLLGCIHSSFLTLLTFILPYCGPNEVDHFFCDIPALLPLACADISLAQRVSFTNVGLVSLVCFLLILVSYTQITISILRIRSTEGHRRAFSTCNAHLIAIFCAYGPIITVYLQPTPNPMLGTVVQILMNLVGPMLNPLIYTLRNKEVKTALKKILHRTNHVPKSS
ncbi:PREDICTED: LOW QUALITY PROTEIN: putative olfactory receptor 10D3 [Ceratotherium simum simum]|uniref:LOW QUALITY PROTEIN: putative olfactory receptor 10D3 n=1 Tax=Ceratotherium simum simum TaxID=73337 RepID=A0ABM1CLR0_CERSS|nr:PREDICTED: LOW QUALITY PROTEIN: putative olfactory receptor 10D3 [Ceratotherium simum simum]